ncbi:SRPBCC family protein [Pseudofrankia asymbiotica]|uniref:SRPBCC family protein n=1 Tax=Pseudofrankia asymbiotica TaxID=1834516 RepID=UPI0009767F5F|nr:SRPBCC family protein [Pseudofrankia asymbiotica]
MARDDGGVVGAAAASSRDGGGSGEGGGGRAANGLQSFELVVESSAPTGAVFALLADGASWSSWAGPLIPRSRWYRTGAPAPGGVGAIRELGLRPVLSREEIVEYVPPRRIAYTIVSGIPVHGYKGIVELDPLPGGGTRITWRATFVPAYRGTGPLLRLFALTSVGSLARHLAKAAAAGRTPGGSAASPAPGAPPGH